MTPQDVSRSELLALTPSHTLGHGFFDQAGQPRAELQGVWATAAAVQLRAAELSPQELEFTIEALRQVWPLHAEPPLPGHAEEALREALAVVEGMIRQPNNKGLAAWLTDCVAQVRGAADMDALLLHTQAVLRQYAVLAAFPSSPDSSSPDSSSPDSSSPDTP